MFKGAFIFVHANANPKDHFAMLAPEGMVMAMYGYKISFAQMNMGYGSAISVGIFVVSLLVIGGSQKLVNWTMKDKGVE